MTEPNSPEAAPPPPPAADPAAASAPPAVQKPVIPPRPGGLRAASKTYSGERQVRPNARPTPGAGSKPAAPAVKLPESHFSIRELDQGLDAELEAAMGGMSSTDMYGDLSKQQKKHSPPPGPKMGKVIRVHGPDVFMSVPGGRSEGILPVMQFPEGPPALGSEFEIHIEGYDPANGLLRLSRQGAAVVAEWSTIAENQVVEARVTAVNKGGLEVTVNNIRGFMPISQIDMYRVERPEDYLNQKLICVVTEANSEERNLVVSRRALLERERDVLKEKLWAEIAEGQVRTGIVRSVRDFGAFVDLGGADGLLHVSEISWTRVADATQAVQPGQNVQVVVLKVDHEKRKLSLGMKQLLTSPWETAALNYPVGTIVSGKVTRLMEFGAFVEIEPGIEGLIHISELAPSRTRRVSDVVKPDQVVSVKVLSVTPAERRMSLSLKAALEEPPVPEEEETDEEVPEMKPRPKNLNLRGGIGE
jgi:small subunit ribosomal protein S1